LVVKTLEDKIYELRKDCKEESMTVSPGLLVAVVIVVRVLLVPTTAESPLEKQWQEYKKKYNKHYNHQEDEMRFKIFKAKLAEIRAHNELYREGKTSYTEGVNQFTDLTSQEFSKMFTGVRVPGLSD